MCGICGVGLLQDRVDPGMLEAMCSQMSHRGPDAQGIYINEDERIGLGHRRLSIIDLETGSQPMRNRDGSVIISYNGEVYNFRELRKELINEGSYFQTRSDTEVVLRAYEKYGMSMVEHLNGMFALAIWDQNLRRLLLLRDRLGVKPLFYAFKGGKLAFASEVKSILVLPWISREVDPCGLRYYLSFRYVPHPHTMWKDIKKLPQGHWLVWENGKIILRDYWQIEKKAVRLSKNEQELEEQFAMLLEDSVRLRTIADVPVGAFLSGGIDSASIVCLMSRCSGKPPRTFSIGFGARNDETEIASYLASKLGSEHTSIVMKPSDLRLVRDAAGYMDEPLGDAIILPMLLLSKAAAGEVKVVLTGEGADELLGGYVHQKDLFHLLSARRRYGHAFELLARICSFFSRITPISILDALFEYPDSLGEKGRRRLSILLRQIKNPTVMYLTHISLFMPADLEMLLNRDMTVQYHSDIYLARLEDNLKGIGQKPDDEIFDSLLCIDFDSWLPDNILLKQDKMTMAASLEGRTPYLDYRLVEFASSLPLRWKLGRNNKWILRDASNRWIPQDMRHSLRGRKKQAFYVPLSGAFRGEFERLVRDWLNEGQMKSSGWFNLGFVKGLIRTNREKPEMLSSRQLMSLVILEMWRQEMMKVPVLGKSGVRF